MPGHQGTFLIKSCGNSIVPHWTVIASLDIILTSPDYFHRLLYSFSDINCLNNKIRMGVCPAAKTSTQQCSMEPDLFRFESCNSCCCIPVSSLELRASPDFAAIITKIDKTVQGLHGCMGEIRDFILITEFSCRFFY